MDRHRRQPLAVGRQRDRGPVAAGADHLLAAAVGTDRANEIVGIDEEDSATVAAYGDGIAGAGKNLGRRQLHNISLSGELWTRQDQAIVPRLVVDHRDPFVAHHRRAIDRRFGVCAARNTHRVEGIRHRPRLRAVGAVEVCGRLQRGQPHIDESGLGAEVAALEDAVVDPFGRVAADGRGNEETGAIGNAAVDVDPAIVLGDVEAYELVHVRGLPERVAA